MQYKCGILISDQGQGKKTQEDNIMENNRWVFGAFGGLNDQVPYTKTVNPCVMHPTNTNIFGKLVQFDATGLYAIYTIDQGLVNVPQKWAAAQA